MRNLVPCPDDPALDFDAIAAEKTAARRQPLRRLRPQVLAAYAGYAASAASLETMEPLPLSPVDRRALQHGYDGPTSALDDLKARIRRRQSPLASAVCQYCNLNAPRTFDHYLPKGLFAEFAAYAPNLVPCCAECNSRRGGRWREGGQRQHVHLYYDPVDPSEGILEAALDFAPAAPTAAFRLKPLPASNPRFFRLLAAHIRQLGLLERFHRAAPALLSEMHRQLQGWGRRVPRGELRALLAEEREREERLVGVHSWRVAVLGAIASDDRFAEFALETPLSVWTESEVGT